MDSANFTPLMKRTPAEMNALTAEEFTTLLGGVYEHSPWIAEAAAGQRPFANLEELKAALRQVVQTAPEWAQFALIHAHPDLAGKLALDGRLTPFSALEQAASGILSMNENDLNQMVIANASYRERFGFPFIICARRHTKASILAAMAARLQNDPATERTAALTEIHHIAQLRIDDLLCPEN